MQKMSKSIHTECVYSKPSTRCRVFQIPSGYHKRGRKRKKGGLINVVCLFVCLFATILQGCLIQQLVRFCAKSDAAEPKVRALSVVTIFFSHNANFVSEGFYIHNERNG
jgi:hypothetical protein